MAGTLLHIILAEQALKKARIPGPAKQEIENSIMDFRLGAVLFDLPYYEHLLFQGLFLLSKQDIHFNRWGSTLHTRSPVGLCQCLLDSVTCPADRALALGALTHAAADMVFHPEIERRVSLSAEGRTHPNRMHQFIENQMDIHIHEQVLGHPGIGTPYTRKMLCIVPHPGWSIFFRNAIFRVHGEMPSKLRIRSWLFGLRLFGVLHSRPNFFWVPSKADPDADRNDTAMHLAEETVARSARYIEIGYAYFEKIPSARDLKAVIPNIDLASGNPA